VLWLTKSLASSSEEPARGERGERAGHHAASHRQRDGHGHARPDHHALHGVADGAAAFAAPAGARREGRSRQTGSGARHSAHRHLRARDTPVVVRHRLMSIPSRLDLTLCKLTLKSLVFEKDLCMLILFYSSK